MRKQGTFSLPLFGSLPLLLEAHLALRISEIRKVNHFFSFAVFLPPSCFCSAALLLLLLPLQRQKERLAALLSFRVPRTTRPLALSPSSLLRRSSEGFQKSKRGSPPLPQRRERKGGRERGGTSGEVLRRGFFFAGTGDKSIGRLTPLFFFIPFRTRRYGVDASRHGASDAAATAAAVRYRCCLGKPASAAVPRGEGREHRLCRPTTATGTFEFVPAIALPRPSLRCCCVSVVIAATSSRRGLSLSTSSSCCCCCRRSSTALALGPGSSSLGSNQGVFCLALVAPTSPFLACCGPRRGRGPPARAARRPRGPGHGHRRLRSGQILRQGGDQGVAGPGEEGEEGFRFLSLFPLSLPSLFPLSLSLKLAHRPSLPAPPPSQPPLKI